MSKRMHIYVENLGDSGREQVKTKIMDDMGVQNPSISYDRDSIFVSSYYLNHAIDIESKRLNEIQASRILTDSDYKFMKQMSLDSRVVWCLKECIIKYFGMKLMDLISNNIHINYMSYDEESLVILYKGCTLYIKYGYFKDAAYVAISEKHPIEMIRFIGMDE